MPGSARSSKARCGTKSGKIVARAARARPPRLNHTPISPGMALSADACLCPTAFAPRQAPHQPKQNRAYPPAFAP
eukprot:4942473-Prymnesium_polylepis.1